MNVHAHMSGQISGQAPNQVSAQLSGLSQQNGSSLPSQIPNLGTLSSMDPDFLTARKIMRERITQFLQRRSQNLSVEWFHRLPIIVKRLEELLLKDAASKEDYMNMETFDHRILASIKNLPSQSHPMAHHISSSSTISTMIPTPGMPHTGSTSSIVSCSTDNSMITTSGAGMVAQATVNMGNLLRAANGFTGIGHSASFNSSDGSIPNGYQQSPVNVSIGSGGNSLMPSMGIPRHSNQMIPTPGLNNPQPVLMNSECANGDGFSNNESSMTPQQQQHKHYVGSQNSRILHGLGGQIGVGTRSNMQQRSSAYGFPNGVMNGGLALIGSNMQLVNGSVASEGYLSTASYGSSPKPSQQFDPQHHQPMLPTSLSQQNLSMSGDSYAMNATDLSGLRGVYGSTSSVVSSVNNQNMNPVSLHSKSETNPALVSHQASLQSMQQAPHIKSQLFDHSQKMNFQSSQSSREHLLQSQQQMQKFQHQQFQQQPNQPYAQFVQNQHQQQQKQQSQQLMLKADTLRQPSMTTSLRGSLMSEHGTESHNELLLPQAAEQFNLSELHNQYQQTTSANDSSKSAQLLGQISGPQDFHSSFSQSSVQMLPPYQQVAECPNEFSCLSSGSQPEALLHGQWHPQLLQKPHVPDKSTFEQHIQEDFHQRITGQDEAQRPRFSLEGCITRCASATKGVAVPESSSGGACGLGNPTREQQFFKQKRWLLLLYHARRCTAPAGKCQEVNCIKVQHLLMHMKSCKEDQCVYPRCRPSKVLIEHYRTCRATNCPVCIPALNFAASKRKTLIRPPFDIGLRNQMNDSWGTFNAADADRTISKTCVSSIETSDDTQSPLKRMKVQHTSPSIISLSETSPIFVPPINQPHASEEAPSQVCQQPDLAMSTKSEVTELKIDSSISSERGISPVFGNNVNDDAMNVYAASSYVEPVVSNEVDVHAKQETILVKKETDHTKMEVKQEADAPLADPVAGSKSGKPKIKGVSLTELFTPEQIREHIFGLRQWVGQSKAKAEKNQAMENSMSENSCQLCAVEKLTFEPPPIYCTPCGARIKRNAMYYTMGTGDTRYYFCIPCYNEARGDTLEVDGTVFPKARLEKKRNDEETEEWWVQCDKCEAWQHQICTLFNGRRNDGGQAEYTCPNCYVEEVERGERTPLPQSAVLGAKDLPRTMLSDHIEQRLFRRLRQERQDRAKHQGKSFDEVPGAEALVVRVVSSVDKKLEVKQRFLEIFQEENYPIEFPYKSKVILLFQKIEGVEVCLFGMYVQEFGSECQFPNQRRVYLSYLDSVKYFRPETKAVTGEALRTFVYHEILIGYLEYCKIRGFTSCYIWACPPLKGEDYILYCHPEIQKTPKSDKLREWYLAMLRKAAKENIVVELTNLYDHFFVTTGECKAKVTAARLPYFDGDYWPGAAEDMINQLQQEEDGKKQQKKGKTKKTITKRALKAAGQADLSGNASKDALLMQKLGETICPMKEDFIMVHLQHACTHCCLLMASGTLWICNQCKNFQLCEKCHDAEQRLEERDRHPINSREKHMLCSVEISDVPSDTKDKDEILESEFFDTRQAFLSLCQGNHYQYDTLRRAKHSSMMVLYHLHNPTAPAFVTTCNVCHHDIETGQGWRCEICPDFDVCNACYRKDGGVDHPHKLTNHPSMADRDAQNKEARQKRVLQLRKMLDLLVHASQCRFPHCQYPNCRKVKGLFRHGIHCKIRASGGCLLCKKMWYLLQLHARACKVSECHVPRCKDLKEHLRRLQQQSDSRRRAAVMEMMRQRAAEVAGNSG